jgi:hypothetical protein
MKYPYHMTLSQMAALRPRLTFLDDEAARGNFLGDWNIMYHNYARRWQRTFRMDSEAPISSSQNKSECL